jgi:hypothetical protein
MAWLQGAPAGAGSVVRAAIIPMWKRLNSVGAIRAVLVPVRFTSR